MEETPEMAKAAKRKATKAKKGKQSKSKDMLIVGSKVKQAIRNYKMNVAGDAPAALNEVVYWYIDQAAKRAAANGRKTVRPYDFIAF
jgi:histone H3/H4